MEIKKFEERKRKRHEGYLRPDIGVGAVLRHVVEELPLIRIPPLLPLPLHTHIHTIYIYSRDMDRGGGGERSYT